MWPTRRGAGRLAFVVMHMPTQDPGDQDYRDTIAFNHVMGKGVTTDDNAKFEQVAEAGGVDGVFVGHIKGQFLYRGGGNIPYYIDGGAGGELYTQGPVGTDHGYWHGYRLIRASGGRFRTDSVPIFVHGGISVVGPSRLARAAWPASRRSAGSRCSTTPRRCRRSSSATPTRFRRKQLAAVGHVRRRLAAGAVRRLPARGARHPA